MKTKKSLLFIKSTFPLFASTEHKSLVSGHTSHGVLMARILEQFAISSSSGKCFIRTVYYDPFVLGGPAQHGSKVLRYTSPFAMTSL